MAGQSLSLRDFLYTLYAWPLALLSTCFWGSISLLGSLLDRRGRLAHSCMVYWSRLNLWMARVHVTLEGSEHVRRDGPQIFASNHQSLVDIVTLAARLPVPFRFVAKAELFKLPFLGWHMRRSGYIALVRENPRAAMQALLAAADKIRAGVNTVIFPEGTRSPDGALLPFKRGGFVLASKAGVPLVPVGLWGTHAVVPKGSYRVRPGRVAMVIGPPVETPQSARRPDPDELSQATRKAIAACVERARALAEGSS